MAGCEGGTGVALHRTVQVRLALHTQKAGSRGWLGLVGKGRWAGPIMMTSTDIFSPPFFFFFLKKSLFLPDVGHDEYCIHLQTIGKKQTNMSSLPLTPVKNLHS